MSKQSKLSWATRFAGRRPRWCIKVGRLSSAFGAFPLHYDDADNPLLDQPLSYIQTLTLRNDQLPCGVADLLRQNYGYVSNGCGGAPGWGDGIDAGEPVRIAGHSGRSFQPSGGWAHSGDQRFAIESVELEPCSAIRAVGAGRRLHHPAGIPRGISGFRGPYLAPDARAASAGRIFGAQLSGQRRWVWRSSGRAGIGARAANGSASNTICLASLRRRR